jgi:hypothetical protein
MEGFVGSNLTARTPAVVGSVTVANVWPPSVLRKRLRLPLPA